MAWEARITRQTRSASSGPASSGWPWPASLQTRASRWWSSRRKRRSARTRRAITRVSCTPGSTTRPARPRRRCAGAASRCSATTARNEAETVKLHELERRANANGVPGVRWLGAGALRELEPDVAGVAALLSPTTAIVDYPAIARSFAADVAAAGGQVLTGTPVTAVRRHGTDRVDLDTPGGSRRLSRLVICAGLQADLLAATVGDDPAPEIVPFRGEYLRLRPHARDRVRHLIYPVPDPRYPFLGVHLTPRVDGEADLGPNAVLALSRLVRSAAFRRLARQHWRTGVREMGGSLWRRAYLAEARSYLPWLRPGDVTSAPAGVRAQAVDPDGALVDDFRIHQVGPVTTVRNAPSPAATASMAIAEHIVAELKLPLGKER